MIPKILIENLESAISDLQDECDGRANFEEETVTRMLSAASAVAGALQVFDSVDLIGLYERLAETSASAGHYVPRK